MYFPTTNFAFLPILTALYKCYLYICWWVPGKSTVAVIKHTLMLDFLSYTLGYLNGHFDPILPVVSDSGNYMPEAAIFTMIIITVGNLRE